MILTSMLDTDLYKLTMMQSVLHQYPGAQVRYRFMCRTQGVDLSQYIKEIEEEIAALCTLRFKNDELDYLRRLRFFKSDFVDFLWLFQFDKKYIHLKKSPHLSGGIELEIQGPWLHTILFEVPLLAIISEIWFRHTSQADFSLGEKRLKAKIQSLVSCDDAHECLIAEYGTRRRYSRAWHEHMLPILHKELGSSFAGTSNVLFAKRFGFTPLGSIGHEFFQAFQALGPRLRDSQVAALEAWAHEYRGDLGIALSDVVGLDPFLRDFDLYFCKLFDGVRHDSGDPFVWGERMLEHFTHHRIDPQTKLLVFSDSLDFDKVKSLFQHFHGRCKLSFGVGTNLTNDLGPIPLQIVIKMIECNSQPVAKISDSQGKQVYDNPSYFRYLCQVFGLPSEN